MHGNRKVALVSIAWLVGAFCGWALRGAPARAAQAEWHVAPTSAPGVLFWRYSTSGDVQGCASTQREGEFQCQRLTLVERDVRPAR